MGVCCVVPDCVVVVDEPVELNLLELDCGGGGKLPDKPENEPVLMSFFFGSGGAIVDWEPELVDD